MCKFCDSLKEKSLLSYDNYKSMNISYGQYQGVNVYGHIYMKGNMLSIGCGGSYRSKFDCYYEDEGLDCDSENAHNSDNKYIQIKYCPFCGRKLEDHTYEKQKAKDDINELKEKLKWFEQDLRDLSISVYCTWECNKKVLHNIQTKYNSSHDKTEYNYIEYDNDNPLTINQIKEKYSKIKFDIQYGCLQNNWNKHIYAETSTLNLNTKIHCKWSGCGQWHSINYKLTDDMYFKFVKLGYIKHNEDKYNTLKKNQQNVWDKIINTKKEIKKLEHYLKSLN